MSRDPPNLTTLRAQLAGHAVDLAAIRLRLLLRKAGFDPNQPRIPAGQPGDGPQPLLHPAYVGPTAPIVEAALALFAWLNAGPRGGGTAVLAFNAREYRPGERPDVPPHFVGMLTDEQTSNACPQHEHVQRRATAIANTVRREGNYLTPQGYGTLVHTELASEINGGPRRQDNPVNPNFRAEYSVRKSQDESYGIPGTIRVDVFENIAERRTVCVYDIKTGLSGLSRPRMDEIALNVHRLYSGTQRIIVIEVRP